MQLLYLINRKVTKLILISLILVTKFVVTLVISRFNFKKYKISYLILFRPYLILMRRIHDVIRFYFRNIDHYQPDGA